MKILFACIAVASALSGCGGGGGAVPPTDSGAGNVLSFGTMLGQYQALEATIDATPFSTPNQLPISGSATYSGYAGFGNAAQTNVELLSKADLSVDFGASTLSGSLSNFRNVSGENYSGIVTFQNGAISGATANSNSLHANLSGSLTSSAGTHSFTGNLTGAFSGNDAGFAEGLINGNFAGAPLFGYLYTQQP
jgi:hypothetical protein